MVVDNNYGRKRELSSTEKVQKGPELTQASETEPRAVRTVLFDPPRATS